MHPHLNLTKWPFQVVPDRSECTFMADREALRADLAHLVTSLVRRDTSSVHVFWSWFGAGKTHTLHYLSHKLEEEARGSMAADTLSVYTEFPRSANGFIDLYRSFMREHPSDMLAEAFLEISTGSAATLTLAELRKQSIDVHTVLRTLLTGTALGRTLAEQWLRAEPLSAGDCRQLGVLRRLSSSEDALRSLVAIVHLLRSSAMSQGASTSRVLWMIDEFQRINNIAPKIRADINSGLHTSFNASPRGLSLFVSFSGKPASELPNWFSPELRDRIGLTKVMILPPMTRPEAFVFVRELLTHYRINATETLFPFTSACCEYILRWVDTHGELKPRFIMQAFNAVLEEADVQLETGAISEIDEQLAAEVLGSRLVLSDIEN